MVAKSKTTKTREGTTSHGITQVAREHTAGELNQGRHCQSTRERGRPEARFSETSEAAARDATGLDQPTYSSTGSTLGDAIAQCSQQIVATLSHAGRTIATAESLTGGLVCARIVDTAAASNCLRGGACTYVNDMKTRVLGVDAAHLENHGPVNAQTAQMMARGASKLFDSDYAISTTGIAGPGPSDGIAAGTVFIGWYDRTRDTALAWQFHFAGDREEVRHQTVKVALRTAADLINS